MRLPERRSGAAGAAKKFVVVAFAALMLVVTAGTALAPPARAADPAAYLTETVWLTANPADHMANRHLVRDIYLRAARYEWLDVTTRCLRRLDLPAGWYSWRTLLDPKDGRYRITAVLEGPVVVQRQACEWVLSESKNYLWGDSLRVIS